MVIDYGCQYLRATTHYLTLTCSEQQVARIILIIKQLCCKNTALDFRHSVQLDAGGIFTKKLSIKNDRFLLLLGHKTRLPFLDRAS